MSGVLGFYSPKPINFELIKKEDYPGLALLNQVKALWKGTGGLSEVRDSLLLDSKKQVTLSPTSTRKLILTEGAWKQIFLQSSL